MKPCRDFKGDVCNKVYRALGRQARFVWGEVLDDIISPLEQPFSSFIDVVLSSMEMSDETS